MFKKENFFKTLLALVLAVELCLPEFFLWFSAGHSHACLQEDCIICVHAEGQLRLLEKLLATAAVAAGLKLAFAFVRTLGGAAQNMPAHTLVGMRVKLTC